MSEQATSNAQDTLGYGTHVVGGVSPGKGGKKHLGLPVFDTVREVWNPSIPHPEVAHFHCRPCSKSVRTSAPSSSRPSSPPRPLWSPSRPRCLWSFVSVAEHIPVHDLMRVQEVLRTQSKSRLVGPNSPGIIAPGRCRVGIMPFRQYQRGCLGIVSKSGTLSYESVGATTAAGLGQSLVIAVGGDSMPGTRGSGRFSEPRLTLLLDAQGPRWPTHSRSSSTTQKPRASS